MRTHQIQIDGITIAVQFKPIKNMYLRVIPPDGAVHISAPISASIEIAERFAADRIAWIVKQRAKCAAAQLNSPQQFARGESVLLWGRSYPLEVVHNTSKSGAFVEDGAIVISIAADSSTYEERLSALNTLYRRELEGAMREMCGGFETIVGQFAREWRIRDMKTKWGTCNITARRIWLSLNLAKKPVNCLESVIVHELCHLIEKGHNKRFYSLMDRYYPRWREVKELMRG